LKELDLDANMISDWAMINHLNIISSLQILRLNENQLSTIMIESGAFPNLKVLQLNSNVISEWIHISHLNKLDLRELRFRSNPVLTHEKPLECRQNIIARISSLSVLNGTHISDNERKWAEIDYYKKHGLEYLQIQRLPAEKKEMALADFSAVHGRYLEIVEKFGEPEEAELKVQESNLKATLVAVHVCSPDLAGSASTSKKLPLSMTVAKLKALIGRLYRQHIKGGDLQMSIRSAANPELEQDLDNDMRDLAYYSVQNGDTLLVRWLQS